MYQKLIGAVLTAILTHCSDAACMSSDEINALNAALPSQLSQACQQTIQAAGSPPECGQSTKFCGFLVYINTSTNCVGAAASCNMIMDQLPSSATTSTKAPAGQNCIPDACNNDDMSKYMNMLTETMKAETCRSATPAFEASIASAKDTLASLGVSMELIFTVESAMSCDRNSAGEFVIDGTTIPVGGSNGGSDCEGGSQPDGRYKLCIGDTDCRSSNNYCGEGDCDGNSGMCVESEMKNDPSSGSGSSSMSTCGDVKRAYKMSGCCGNPQKEFSTHGRRLSEEDELIEAVKSELRHAKAVGGTSKARTLAISIQNILAAFP